MDHLSDTNLNKLETMIQSVCPVLIEKIIDFKELQGELPNIYTDSGFNREAGKQVESGNRLNRKDQDGLKGNSRTCSRSFKGTQWEGNIHSLQIAIHA